MSRTKDQWLEAMESSSPVEGKEIEYRTLQCKNKNCKAVLEIKAYIHRGFADHEDVKCPKCGKVAGNIRADEGFEITKVSKPRGNSRKKGSKK